MYYRVRLFIAVLAGLLSYVPVGVLFSRTAFYNATDFCSGNSSPGWDGGDGDNFFGTLSTIPFGVECTYTSSIDSSSSRIVAQVFHDFGTVPILLSAVLLLTLMVLPFTLKRHLPTDHSSISEQVVSGLIVVVAAAPWTLMLLGEAAALFFNLSHQP